MKHEEKVFGVLKKITLDPTTNTLKSKLSKPDYETYLIPRERYFELNIYEMTFGYKDKPNDKFFKRSFGYKQVYKYTLKLQPEEESELSKSSCRIKENKLGFKILCENKSILVFCKSVFDLKMWIEAFQKFFERKTEKINFLQMKNESKIEMRENKVKEKENIPRNSNRNISKLKFFIELLLDNNSDLIKQLIITNFYTQKLRDFDKANKEKKLLENANVMKKEMEDEFEFFISDFNSINNNSNLMLNLGLNPPKDSNSNKVNVKKLKREVVLLGEERNIKIYNDIINSNMDSKVEKVVDNSNSNSMTLDFEDDFNGSNTIKGTKSYRKEIITRADRANIPKFSEEFQYFPKREVEKVIINDNEIIPAQNTNNKEDESLNNGLVNSFTAEEVIKAKQTRIITKYHNENSINILTNFPESTSTQTNKFYNKLTITTHENEINYEDPHSIDYQHFKPNLSIIDQEANIVNNRSDNQIHNKSHQRSHSMIDSPHFSNISIIAQRFNKIDNIDDWKLYINK